eukprot:2830634-Rhodomonas_salina.1
MAEAGRGGSGQCLNVAAFDLLCELFDELGDKLPRPPNTRASELGPAFPMPHICCIAVSST